MRTTFTSSIIIFLLGFGGYVAGACVDDDYVTVPDGSAGSGGIAFSVSTGGASAAGGGASCADQCPEPTQVCVGRTCTDGQCGTALEPAGAISPWQISGDCKSFMCDGQGSATEVPDYADTLDDQNACTADSCSSTGPVNQPVDAETPCTQNGGKYCNAFAECVECITDAHCGAELCLAGQCVPKACANMVQDPNETGLNCGGPCGATCETGQGCLAADDCVHGVCAGNVCAAPTCNDGVKNGDESDVDCGGSCASKCGPYQACTTNVDCAGNQCSGTLCIPNCNDGVKNNAETDVDCGGPGCADCNIGSSCQVSVDCITRSCTEGVCCNERCDDDCMGCVAAETGLINGICAPPLSDQNPSCGPPRALAIHGGMFHTCAVLSDRTLKCWGTGAFGALGYESGENIGDEPGEMGAALPPVDLGAGRTVISVAGGFWYTTCAALDDGTVKCWGANLDGHLGTGVTGIVGDDPGEMGDSLSPVPLGTGKAAVAIAGRYRHQCALFSDGTVKCWGTNMFGQLGLGDTDPRGDNPSNMGDVLPTVALGADKSSIAVAVGSYHSCALLSDGHIKCWGANDGGQLGRGDTIAYGGNVGEMGNALTPIDLGGLSATAITAGLAHTCALLANGTVKCWGSNAEGQLGLGDMTNRGDNSGEMGSALPSIELGIGRTVTAISAGKSHTCAMLDSGAVKCWGSNAAGQLGLGDTNARGDGPGEMGNALPNVDLGTDRTAISLFAVLDQTCAVLDDHSTKCWGRGGVLGLGDTEGRGDVPGEMGDALPAVKLFSDVW